MAKFAPGNIVMDGRGKLATLHHGDARLIRYADGSTGYAYVGTDLHTGEMWTNHAPKFVARDIDDFVRRKAEAVARKALREELGK